MWEGGKERRVRGVEREGGGGEGGEESGREGGGGEGVMPGVLDVV